MANIEIVIKVPEEDYEYLKSHNKNNLYNVILNGTILPKGHGRLVDADALEKEIVNGIKAGNYEEGYESYAHINSIDDVVECVKYADTIIEADKSESVE